MERKIGEVFNDGPTKLEVVASRSCIGCFYEKKSAKCIFNNESGECSESFRADKTSVIFKEVKT